jgi:hypothetical protein
MKPIGAICRAAAVRYRFDRDFFTRRGRPRAARAACASLVGWLSEAKRLAWARYRWDLSIERAGRMERALSQVRLAPCAAGAAAPVRAHRKRAEGAATFGKPARLLNAPRGGAGEGRETPREDDP